MGDAGAAAMGAMITTVDNYIDGRAVPPVAAAAASYLDVRNPATSAVVGRVALSGIADVEAAVAAAAAAFPAWSAKTTKARAAVLLCFHGLVREHAEELARLVVLENGKNLTEARADVAKGNETVEYAASLPCLSGGSIDEVSGGVTCRDRRDPLGVVASIVPFNFPFMVPHWTLPIALAAGNTIVLKPSEKVPLTMWRAVRLLEEAGVPPGVVNLVNGGREVAEALADHPDVRAVTFVGSSPVAKAVSARCRARHTRCTALGGAKNHLIALPDCDAEGAAGDVVVSFAGCAGQRCMAASVLLIVGPREGAPQRALLLKVLEKASRLEPGTGPGQMGPVIDAASLEKIRGYVDGAERGGATVLLDGRTWSARYPDVRASGGHWIGPTVLLHEDATDPAMTEEIFGPVLSVHHVDTWQEAVAIENANPFGNAAAIYTTHGGHAEWFLTRMRAAMLGVNVGIPVPREPFSFGGLYGTRSKYGDMDITGDGALEFFTHRIKITSRWPAPTRVPEYAAGAETERPREEQAEEGPHAAQVDHAHFAGRM